jgi:membrane-associated phospholipid phosphatase
VLTRTRLALIFAIASTVYVAVSLTIAFDGTFPGDHLGIDLANRAHSHGVVEVTRRIGQLAEALVVVALIFAAWIAAKRRGPTRYRALALIGVVLVSLAIKWLTNELVWRPATGLQGTPDEYPSGHATATLALALQLVLSHRGRVRRVSMAIAACSVVGVGVSRILLEVHFVSDVVAGWLLAIAVVAGLGWAQTTIRRADPDRATRPGAICIESQTQINRRSQVHPRDPSPSPPSSQL